MTDRVVAKEAIDASLADLARQAEEVEAALATAVAQHEAAVAATQAELARIRARAEGLRLAAQVVEAPPPDGVSPPPPPSPPPAPVTRRTNLHGFTVATNEGDTGIAHLKALDAGLKGGRKSTVVVTFPGAHDRPWYNRETGMYRAISQYSAIASVSVPLTFGDEADTFGARWDVVITGDRDSLHKQFAQKLVRDGQPEAIIRLGWEMDLRGSFPYGLQYDFHAPGDARNFVKYKAAFRRIASVYLDVSPKFVIDWCHFRDPTVRHQGKTIGIDPRQYFPDDTGERLIRCAGVDIYDGDNNISRATADVQFKRTKKLASGALVPTHLEAWYQLLCKELGIPLFAIPECGIRCWEEMERDNEDNPGFVEALLDWLGSKPNILYWAWFHRGTHKIWPETIVGTKRATNAFIAEFPKWAAKVGA